ncbi:MAG: hypothetical protein IPN29_07755 [Saprospiraceae bacterium]|nr:hypothetical protein [Saprospiraceae bacterium]
MQKDKPEKTEATTTGTYNNRLVARKNKTGKLVFWIILTVGLLTVIYLVLKGM